MARLLFEKTGNAVWISHLDLMRLFQRAFKRAGLPLKHTQGFNPRPSVSIALPLSVGVESNCELLDFELDGEMPDLLEIQQRLNTALVEGVRVLKVYSDGRKIKELALLRCKITLEYDDGVAPGCLDAIDELFARESLVVSKKGKTGLTEQDIIPLVKELQVEQTGSSEVVIHGLICCQNPALNPAQLAAAIERYQAQWKPDFVRYSRQEIYDNEKKIFR